MNNELWGGPLRVPYNELWEPKLIVRLTVCFLSAKWLTMNFSGGQLIVERPWRGGSKLIVHCRPAWGQIGLTMPAGT